MNKSPFVVGKTYSRKDIFRIMEVPLELQVGTWFTGYHRYGDDWFIFANVNTPGRTGHDYDNKFVGDDFLWYGKTGSHLGQNSIRSLINPPGNVYIFVREDNKNPKFVYMGNGRVKEYKDTVPVTIIWSFDIRGTRSGGIPQEILYPESSAEGTTKQIHVNRFETDLIAKARCIDHYGTRCTVCSFDFLKKYGDIGRGFIQVHHIVPLREITKGYIVNPVKDLRPVCPNCHAMLHLRDPAYTIEELQAMLR